MLEPLEAAGTWRDPLPGGRRILPLRRNYPHLAATSRPLSALALRALLQAATGGAGGGRSNGEEDAGASSDYAVSGKQLVVPGVPGMLSLPTIQLNNINVFPKSAAAAALESGPLEEAEEVASRSEAVRSEQVVEIGGGEGSSSSSSSSELHGERAILSYVPPTLPLQPRGPGVMETVHRRGRNDEVQLTLTSLLKHSHS